MSLPLHVADLWSKVTDWFDWEFSVGYSITKQRYRYDHHDELWHTCENGVRWTYEYQTWAYEGQGYFEVQAKALHFLHKTLFKGWVTDPVTLGAVVKSTQSRWRT